MNLDSLSDRDRGILRDQCADKIEQLLPLTRLGMPWRETFASEASRLSRMDAQIDRSDVNPDRLDWAIAHAFVLREES